MTLSIRHGEGECEGKTEKKKKEDRCLGLLTVL